MTTPPNLTPVVRSLDAEWARLCRRRWQDRIVAWPDLVDDPDRRSALHTVIAAAVHLDHIVDATNRADHRRRTARIGGESVPDPDALLAALVEVAHHDRLAGRIVVQRLMPAVIAASRRWIDGSPERTLDHAVGACWIAIADFDPTRRRRNIAASLVSDVVWIAFRQPMRRRASSELPMDGQTFVRRADGTAAHPLVDLARTVREAERAGVAGVHLELVRELVRAGSTDAVAARRSVTARTIRNHRNVACDEIRAAVAAA